jgi:hypothetical protein
VAVFCEDGNEPSGSIKKAGYCLTSLVTISFSTNILHRVGSKKATNFEILTNMFDMTS